MKDQQALKRYLENDSLNDFDEIVRRHSPMVRTTCARILGNDCGDIDDVAQSVFLILIKKAPKLSEDVVLGGWLYKTAVFVSRKQLRNATVRIKREEMVAEMLNKESNEDIRKDWLDVKPHIDAAMETLPLPQAEAMVARFLEDQSWKEVGESCDCGEDTARKRCQKALEKVQVFLKKRGVVYSSATLAGILSSCSLEASEGFTAATLSSGIKAMTSAGTGGHLIKSTEIAKEILIMIFWKKVAMFGIAILAILMAGFLATKPYIIYGNKISKEPEETGSNAKLASKVPNQEVDSQNLSLNNQNKLPEKLFANYEEFKAIWEDIDHNKYKSVERLFSDLQRLRVPISRDELNEFFEKNFDSGIAKGCSLHNLIFNMSKPERIKFSKYRLMLSWGVRIPFPEKYNKFSNYMSARHARTYDIVYFTIVRCLMRDLAGTVTALRKHGLMNYPNYRILVGSYKKIKMEELMAELDTEFAGQAKTDFFQKQKISIVRRWSDKDPIAALKWVERNAGSRRNSYIRSIILSLMEHDLALGKKYLPETSKKFRNILIHQYAMKSIASYPENTLNFLREESYSFSDINSHLIISRWAESNPQKAAEFVENLEVSEKKKRELLFMVASHWAKENANEATKWAKTFPDSLRKALTLEIQKQKIKNSESPKKSFESALDYYQETGDIWPLKKVIRKMPMTNKRSEPLAKIDRIQNEKTRNELQHWYYEEWIDSNPEEFQKFSSENGIELDNKLQTRLARNWSQRDLKKALEWYKSLAQNKRNATSTLFFCVSMKDDPDKCLSFVENNIAEDERNLGRFAAIYAIVGSNKVKMGKLTELLKSLEPGNKMEQEWYSRIHVKFAYNMAGKDPDAALKWAENLESDNESMQEIYSEVLSAAIQGFCSFAKNPDQVKKTIETHPKLSPAQKKELLKYLANAKKRRNM